MKIGLFIGALVGVFTIAAGASAQRPWVKNRSHGEGMGIRTGNLELHPGLALELGYDSNFLQRSGNQEYEREVSTFILRPSAELTLATLGPQRRAFDAGDGSPPSVTFRGGLATSYQEFLWANREQEEIKSHRNLELQVGGNLDILPERPWGGDLVAEFRRAVSPTNSPEAQTAFVRDSLWVGPGITWRPGGGLFDWRWGYDLRLGFFEQTGQSKLNTVEHNAVTRGRWRFLPRSAVLFDAQLGFHSFPSNDQNVLNNSTPVRSRLGVRSLITNHFGVMALVGWGASFFEATHTPVQDFDSVIAHSEFTWYIMPQPHDAGDVATIGLSSVTLGYMRNFSQGFQASYTQMDRGYLSLAYSLAGSFVVLLDGGYTRYSYPVSYVDADSLRYRAYGEDRVDAQLFAEYRFSDVWGINSTLRYDANLTETLMPIAAAEGQPDFDDLSFGRFQAFLGARWFL
ncbi:hypothetical protein ACFL5O_02365 [Myxococcota bacterium]